MKMVERAPTGRGSLKHVRFGKLERGTLVGGEFKAVG